MTRRERRLAGALAGAVVVVVLALVLFTGSPRPRRGCISVSLAYSTGGALIHRCGASARALCAGVGHPSGITGPPARRVAADCRRAGLRVG